MRSTRASAAIERLKARDGNKPYSMVHTGDNLFYLVLGSGAGTQEKLGQALPLDDFVQFVNSFGPQVARRVSKLDAAFEQQLARKKP
ncbi:hypothetical protein [Herminiimonas sp. CN]|uniref:hypothetical protein n=1 Tax=Herminiimonas sp. CN TaxID=1349818 RepID=UPI0004734AEC|nr:hypothetical protein [Herminiimonas sp. CN]